MRPGSGLPTGVAGCFRHSARRNTARPRKPPRGPPRAPRSAPLRRGTRRASAIARLRRHVRGMHGRRHAGRLPVIGPTTVLPGRRLPTVWGGTDDAPRPSNPTTTTGSTTCRQASTNTIRSSTGGSARERPSPSSTSGARASFAPSGSIRKARANWSRRTRRRTRPARPLVASSHRERLGRAGKRSHPGQQAPGARRYDRPLRHR